MTFVIARTLGAAETGHYALAISTMTTATFVALTGLDQITVRTIAGDLKQGNTHHARAMLKQAATRVLLTGFAAAIAILLASPLTPRIGLPSPFAWPVALAVIALPLLRLTSGVLRASGRPILSQLFDGPAYTGAVAILATVALLTRSASSSLSFAWAYGVAVAMAAALAWWCLRRTAAHWAKQNEARFPSLLSESWRVFAAVVAQVMTDWLILVQIGAYTSSVEVGAYRVAFQIISILSLMVTTVENLTGPSFAGDFRLDDLPAAKRRHLRATLVLLALVGIPSLLGMLFAGPILSIFGTEFERAQTAFRILLGAQLLNVATGPVGVILLMSGRERFSMMNSSIALVVSLILGALLIPRWGAAGAAGAYFAAIFIRNIGGYIVFKSIKQVSRNE